MIAEIVGVKADWRPVRVFKVLFRLEGFAQDFSVDHPGVEVLDVVEDVCLQIILAILFHQFNPDFLSILHHQAVHFLFPRPGAVQIDIAFAPNGQMAEVNRFQGAHVGTLGEVKLGDPLLICRVLVKEVCADHFVLPPRGSVLAFRRRFFRGNRPFLDKDVVVETVVSVKDGHEPHDFCPVGNVVRRIAPACPTADAGKGSADQVVNQRHTLGGAAQADVGEEDVVVNQSRAMADFHKKVL